jgi:hypothetical protein
MTYMPAEPWVIGQTVTKDNRTYIITGVNPYLFTRTGAALPPAGPAAAIGSHLDVLGHIVTTYKQDTPPPLLIGQFHVVGINPTGAWTGQANMIAWANTATVWSFIIPTVGLVATLQGGGLNDDQYYTWSGAEWVQSTTTNNVTNVTNVTNNTTTTAPGVTTGTTILTSADLEWFDPAGYGTLNGPSQTINFTPTAALTRMPSEGKLMIDVDVTGLIPKDSVELQLSFDDGLTWPPPRPNASGINMLMDLETGTYILPLEYPDPDETDHWLWFATLAAPTPTGLKYRFYTQGSYDVTASGPVALRLVSRGNYPTGKTLKLLGVHFK